MVTATNVISWLIGAALCKTNDGVQGLFLEIWRQLALQQLEAKSNSPLFHHPDRWWDFDWFLRPVWVTFLTIGLLYAYSRRGLVTMGA